MRGEIQVFDNKEAWLGARQARIGSSDAAAILGLSRFKSPLALFHEKRGTLAREKREGDLIEWGLDLEEPMARRFHRETGRFVAMPGILREHDVFLPDATRPTKRFALVIDADNERLVSSPDRVQAKEDLPPERLWEDPGILELKNVHFSQAQHWTGEEHEPPLEYIVQVQHQLMVTGLKWASIAALVGGSEFVYSDIERDDDFIAALREKELEFLARVDANDPPEADGTDSTKNLLKRLYPRDTGEIITLPPEALDWMGDYLAAKAEEKGSKQRAQEAANKLQAALGDATMGELPNGDMVSWKLQKRAEYVSKATEFRVLRYHKGRR